MSDDPNLQEVSVPRIWLERLHAAAVRFGTHEEFDYPAEVPESCGWWCDICEQHIDDDDHALGHALHCPVEVVGHRLET
ncbi:MAG: hypothetical protein K0U61_02575 [Alphaproteobacteria bacterium]|nr:hypothetical protein [Alphaproteobacteria bacterium]